MGRGQSEWRMAPLRWGRGHLKKVCEGGDLGQALENTEPAVDQQLCVKVAGWPPPTPCSPHWFLSSTPAEDRWPPTTKALEHAAFPKLHSLLF